MAKEFDTFRSLVSKGEFQQAWLFAEEQAQSAAPGDVFWLNQQALALTRGGRLREARAVVDEALRQNPKSSWTLAALSQINLDENNLQAALDNIEEALSIEPQNGKLTARLLNTLLIQRRYPEVLSRLSSTSLTETEAVPFKVKALKGMNRLSDAAEACHRWLELSPDNRNALWELSRIEIEIDGIDTVCKRFARLAKIPSNPPIYREIYASLCREAGHSDKALNEYCKLAEHSSDPRLARKQAFALAKSGHEKEAMSQIEELLRINPRDIYLHSAYVAAARRINQLSDAACFYERLLLLHPQEKSIYGYLRRCSK